jgi:asparagine synthase (glutamine-hydrolysing)
MCGIAGRLNQRESEPPSEELLRQMLGMLRHRGPDEFGLYLDDQVALGSARLSIVDLAGGQQPISNEDGTLWIVYNGEVFNHPELRAELEGRGHVFSTHTDTEVIVHLYEDLGPECLSRLNGQFAIALWDARARSLFLARDRVGVRPLFYATADDGALVFGSEIKAIFADNRVRRALDPAGIAQVFSFWCPLAPRTSFEGVRQLPPGHYLVAKDGELCVHEYWRHDFAEAATSPRSEQDLIEEFRSLLVDATRVRLRADVPVGAYLSGGLDSSIIAAIVRHLGISRLDTFSIAFSDPEFDESGPQRQMADFLGTAHQVVHATHADIARVLPEVVWHTESPTTRTAPAPMFLLSRLVNDHRYKVVLTGEGADEFLGGYDIFKEAKIRRFWAREPASRRRPQLIRRLYPEIARLGSSAPAFVNAFFGVDLTQTDAPDYSHRVRWRNNSRTHRFLSEAFANASAGAGGEVVYPERFRTWGPLQQAQYLEASIFMSGYLLSSQGDRVAMAHSVEGRYPFLDPRVIEFCNKLPATAKLPVLREKQLLRNAFRDWLPPDIGQRRKRPYRAPIHRCFAGAEAPPYVAEIMSETALASSGCFKPGPAARLFDAVRHGRQIGETDEMALVGILSTELLRQQFVEGFQCRSALDARDRVKKIDRRSAPLRSDAPRI